MRHSAWSLIVGGTVGWLGTYGVNQASVQRYCALPTLQKAKGYLLYTRFEIDFKLSHDVASGNDITQCNKIDKPLDCGLQFFGKRYDVH